CVSFRTKNHLPSARDYDVCSPSCSFATPLTSYRSSILSGQAVTGGGLLIGGVPPSTAETEPVAMAAAIPNRRVIAVTGGQAPAREGKTAIHCTWTDGCQMDGKAATKLQSGGGRRRKIPVWRRWPAGGGGAPR
uniref:Uncharacterized protein n=1 Tax=Aegilops tauschii subsp. strangulata TaxID=200361 RepID=A0A452ZPT4_AEGTS